MGKLGGGELNVSSDVDLVFVYPDDGETDGARPLANREFFERLGRRVIGALNDITPDGYVFRVDMRLRPYGESGPLAVPYSALERYLITQGRAWERYAWLKARALTGARHDELDALVTPFVFRKYLDFDAYDGLRDIHRQIGEQGKRNDYGPNIKLGPGGIREVEFVVQALQIVRGGREPGLRVRGTLPALAAIAERGLLPNAGTAALRDAYVFLRNVEHRLQYRDDQQTQTLPPAGIERAALSDAMGFANGRSLRRGACRAPRRGRRAVRQPLRRAQVDDRPCPTVARRIRRMPKRVRVDVAPLAAVWRGDVAPDDGMRDARGGGLCRSRGAARESRARPRERALRAVAGDVAPARRCAGAAAAARRVGEAGQAVPMRRRFSSACSGCSRR